MSLPAKDLSHQSTVREAVGVFHTAKELEAAVDALLSAGFDRSELSLLASENSVNEKLGHRYSSVAELEDDPDVPRTAYVEQDSIVEGKTALIGGLAYIGAVVAAAPVVASGGSLAVAIIGAVLAGGSAGIFGTFVAEWIGHKHAQDIESQLEHGGLLLWVTLRDAAHEEKALAILAAQGAADVHCHDLPAPDDPADNPLSGVTVDPFLPGATI
ncbi:hypothetical protein [Kiloniella laminariae]|uniref:hypothetical protein n=1 Tax=Kiloniella laminariae TaxID=454162 RepID=UPI000369BEFD|nr:hypothetical protein [Kiloniella laminariae]